MVRTYQASHMVEGLININIFSNLHHSLRMLSTQPLYPCLNEQAFSSLWIGSRYLILKLLMPGIHAGIWAQDCFSSPGTFHSSTWPFFYTVKPTSLDDGFLLSASYLCLAALGYFISIDLCSQIFSIIERESLQQQTNSKIYL
jgi:hypothetical protein